MYEMDRQALTMSHASLVSSRSKRVANPPPIFTVSSDSLSFLPLDDAVGLLTSLGLVPGYNELVNHADTARHWIDHRPPLMDTSEHPISNLPDRFWLAKIRSTRYRSVLEGEVEGSP